MNKGSYLKTSSWFYPVIRFIIVEDVIRPYRRHHIGVYLLYWKVTKRFFTVFYWFHLSTFISFGKVVLMNYIKCIVVKGFKVSLEKMLVNWVNFWSHEKLKTFDLLFQSPDPQSVIIWLMFTKALWYEVVIPILFTLIHVWWSFAKRTT